MAHATERELAEYRRQADAARRAAVKAAEPELRAGFLRLADEWDSLIRLAEEGKAAASVPEQA